MARMVPRPFCHFFSYSRCQTPTFGWHRPARQGADHRADARRVTNKIPDRWVFFYYRFDLNREISNASPSSMWPCGA